MGKMGGLPDYDEICLPTREHMLATFVDETGESFIVGSGGGFLYHLVKQKQPLTKALANAPRLGGFVALLTISNAIPRYALYKLRGDEPNRLDDYVCCGAGAAIMWSPRGFRTASIAASIVTGCCVFMDYTSACLSRARAQRAMAKAFDNNPYN